MKKLKTFLFFLGAGLLLASALALSSCKPENENNNGNENGTTPSGGGEITNPVNIDYNAPEEFEITLTYSIMDGETNSEDPIYYLRCKKGVIYNDLISYFVNDESYATFKQIEETSKWEISSIISSKYTIDALNNAFDIFFEIYGDHESYLETSEAEVVLGRNCTKYTYSYSIYSYTYYIDDEYGICLKFEEKHNDTVWKQWEVTEFKTTGVSLPEIEPDYETQINKYIEENK